MSPAALPAGYLDKTPFEETMPAPPLQHRFLIGIGNDLIDNASNTTPTTAAVTTWRAFTDEEDERLQEAWWELNEEVRAAAVETATKAFKENKDTKGKAKERDDIQAVFDPNTPIPPHHVAVGVDNLFTVNLKELDCSPVFWAGGRIPCFVASWFYPSSTPGKFLPVEAPLAEKLEAAYHRIKPWVPSYADELKAAVALGAEAEQKLRSEIDESHIDAIFQGPDSARLYSRGVASRLSKSILTSFLSSSGQHAGGSLVFRGYEAIQRYQASRTPTKSGSQTPRNPSPSRNGPATPPRSRTTSDASPPHTRPSSPAQQATIKSAATEKLAALLRKKTSVASMKEVSTEQAQKKDQADPATSKASAQVLEDSNIPTVPSDHEDEDIEEKPVQLKNLVLVIHGIGQKLAEVYDSFSFNYAVNQLRANANKHCTDPAFAELLEGQRAQFLPVRWRANLNLEGGSMDKENDVDSEYLTNKVTIGDIEPDGIPFLRSLVSNVLIDLPFYLSHHRSKMTQALVLEANRVYRVFCQRNPDFENNGGKVSLIAHSLGALLATDILSEQPCLVPPLVEQTPAQLKSDNIFCFNTRCCFFVGSPAAFFFFLNGSQLIARSGRERTKDLPQDIALNRSRWGCLAVDDIYNVYYTTDPVAYAMNATVDLKHSKRIKPIAIPSQTSSLLEGIGSSFARVSALWQGISIPSFGSSTAAPAPPDPTDKLKAAATAEGDEKPPPLPETAPARPFPFRTTTYEEMGSFHYTEMKRAEQRFKALNPQGNLDFYLPDDSSFASIPYYGAIVSHANYWSDLRFSAFIVTQILASSKALEASKRKLDGEQDLGVD